MKIIKKTKKLFKNPKLFVTDSRVVTEVEGAYLEYLKGNSINLFFVLLLTISSLYILILQTHLYESTSSILIKNINKETQSPSIMSMISGDSGGNTQDAMVVKAYLSSAEAFNKLDKEFGLSEHYSSSSQDFIQRNYSWNTSEDYLSLFNKRIILNFDDMSSIMTIGFLHTDPITAQKITSFLINEAEGQLNKYNALLAKKHLDFLTRYKDLDFLFKSNPNIKEALSNEKFELLKKQDKLDSISQYQTKQSYEVIKLKQEISFSEGLINKLTKQIDNGNSDKSSKNIFEYSQLKTKVEMHQELYKQTLLQVQSAKVEIYKQSKVMLIITQPTLAYNYSHPQKLRAIFTIFLVLGLLYGILRLIINIGSR
jgi:capsular polysaccharide transport system permease protein